MVVDRTIAALRLGLLFCLFRNILIGGILPAKRPVLFHHDLFCSQLDHLDQCGDGRGVCPSHVAGVAGRPSAGRSGGSIARRPPSALFFICGPIHVHPGLFQRDKAFGNGMINRLEKRVDLLFSINDLHHYRQIFGKPQ